MASAVANCSFLLLCLATVATCQELEGHDVNVTVRIQSQMGAATALSVHCRSDFRGRGVPIVDLGEHLLGDQQLYAFMLVQPFPGQLDRQIYHCVFSAPGYPHTTVGIYWGKRYPHWAGECVLGQCPLWTVTPEGFFCNGFSTPWALAASQSPFHTR